MKIYTKTGDSGTTGLFAGARVAKDHPRIEAYGTIDELNALLGVVGAKLRLFDDSLNHEPLKNDNSECDRALIELITEIQSDLFSIGSQLATPNAEKHGMCLLTSARVVVLEQQIDSADEQLLQLKQFILPGGTECSATLHLARTVCRRAERYVVSLSNEPDMDDCKLPIVYLNRLSDLLFVLARLHNANSGVQDIPWRKS